MSKLSTEVIRNIAQQTKKNLLPSERIEYVGIRKDNTTCIYGDRIFYYPLEGQEAYVEYSDKRETTNVFKAPYMECKGDILVIKLLEIIIRDADVGRIKKQWETAEVMVISNNDKKAYNGGGNLLKEEGRFYNKDVANLLKRLAKTNVDNPKALEQWEKFSGEKLENLNQLEKSYKMLYR